MSAFDRAVQENRQGRICVADIVAQSLPAVCGLVRAQMLVCGEEHDPWQEWSIWSGFAPEFEALPLGASAPLYRAEITTTADGTLSLKFTISQH